MKKHQVLVAIGLLAGTLSNAQDPVIMTINDRQVKKSEFEAVYKKNNGKDSPQAQSVKEYVDLFSLFKSKVYEAESLGLDTLRAFREELAGYRRQLASPYLTDKNTNESLITEAYERMKQEVLTSHILVRIDENALPKDTLEAWTRISLIREAVLGKYPTTADINNYEKLLRNSSEVAKLLRGKDSSLYKIKLNSIKNLQTSASSETDKFAGIAPKTSDDPSVLDRKGELPWFSVFDMVYPFESAAYKTPIGEVSAIVRTRFGYHILKVHDRRVNRGEVQVAHIMVKFAKTATDQEKANAKTKIDEIYAKLKQGQEFESLARQFSDDKQTSDRGGVMAPFKSGRWPKAFEDASFAIKANNEISEPVMTPYGWHILKRIDLKVPGTFNEVKNELKNRVAKDSRSQMGRSALIARVKKENNFKENLKNRDEFLKILDSTYLKATWKAERASKLGNKEIFNLAGKSFTQMDFAKFMETQMTFRPGPADYNDLLTRMYSTWVNESIVAYEDSQLETKYTDFSNLYREYRDGILLFDLTDQKVWGKAIKDTAGLRQFYEKNKGNYLWEERADVTTFKCLNDKVAKEVRKMLKAGKSSKEILDAVNKTSQLNVSVEDVTYLKGENKNVDATWKAGLAEKDVVDAKENKVLVILVNKVMPKSPKTIAECRGPVTADYQSWLDKEWLNYLRSKYKVTVNQEVLNTVK